LNDKINYFTSKHSSLKKLYTEGEKIITYGHPENEFEENKERPIREAD
jgi:hypothetical protein